MSVANGVYGRYLAPRLVHCACALSNITAQRRRVVPHARGVVLEVGIGSGLNLPHYDAQKVDRVIGVDPDETLADMAQKRIDAAPFEVEILRASAEDVPLEKASADTVIATYTFCSIPNLERALSELRRVLKPNGRLLFCEHGRSHRSSTAKWQDRLTPVWQRMAAGCSLNRNITRSVANAGFEIVSADNYVLAGVPACIGFHHLGMARPI